MFSYRPPKSSVWGHAIRPKNTELATQKLNVFLDAWFEPFVRDEGSYDSYYTCHLNWKSALLPNTDWPEEWLKPEYDRSRGSSCMVTLGNGSRISFGRGLMIPISPDDPSSYEFLK